MYILKIAKVRQSFELASPEHTEGLIRSMRHYAGYEIPDGTHDTISDMMASFMFDNEYFMYGLETFAESNNSDIFDYMTRDFNTDELEAFKLVMQML